jgi:Protein of unknown function (DUF2851)
MGLWKRSDAVRPGLYSEAELADSWQERRYSGAWLVDCCGRHLRVVFPGRRWGGPGPDFTGAVLALRDGTLVRGDVEVHQRARAWSGHHHARDPAYGQVVLHVVQCADAVALDGRGGHVPTVELPVRPQLASPGPGTPMLGRALEPGPCIRHAPWVTAVVATAGWERFRERVARFEADLAVAEPDQVVWRAVAEALGFRRNARPFGQLADAVAWPEAASVVRERGPVALAGLLLGTAGLLGTASLPEAQHWRLLQHERGARAALSARSWDRAQLRRANAPAERCRGLAELATRWGQRSAGAAEHVLTAVPAGPAEHVLAAVREAAAARHPRLWRLSLASPWIGRGRAQVIAINVLVPFAAAAGLAAEAEALWPRLPGEPSNRVLRYMAEQLGSPGVRFRGACQQQGLLHLFRHTCAARVCERCPARHRPLDPDSEQ